MDEALSSKMAGGDIKITLADEGAKIKWTDELDEVLPPWEMDEVVPSWDDPHWSRCKVTGDSKIRYFSRILLIIKLIF